MVWAVPAPEIRSQKGRQDDCRWTTRLKGTPSTRKPIAGFSRVGLDLAKYVCSQGPAISSAEGPFASLLLRQVKSAGSASSLALNWRLSAKVRPRDYSWRLYEILTPSRRIRNRKLTPVGAKSPPKGVDHARRRIRGAWFGFFGVDGRLRPRPASALGGGR